MGKIKRKSKKIKLRETTKKQWKKLINKEEIIYILKL